MSQSNVFMQPIASLQQIQSKIRITPSVAGVSGVYILFYLTTELLHAHNSHALEFTPAEVFTGRVWQLVTAGFTEKYLICVVFNLSLLAVSNRFLEPVWGTLEYIKFIVVINIAAYSMNLVKYFVGYVALREESFLYAPFSGGQGLLGGILVGLKQLIPDHVMVRAVPAVRVRHLPLCSFIAALFLMLIRVSGLRYLTVTIGGLASSWIYLRYFQIRDSGRGDFSDALSLASFFPESAQPHVIKYSSAVSSVVDGMLQKRQASKTVDLKTFSTNVNIITDPVSERRRQLALQALNERLQKTDDVDWPSSDSEPEATPATDEIV